MKENNKKILIIRLGAIGDVVHTTIIPKSIKAKHPNYVIHYLSEHHIAPLIENNPYIDKVLSFNASKKRDKKYIFQLGQELYKEHYDIVFNLTHSLRNYILAFMAFPHHIVSRKRTKGLWVEDYFYTAKKIIKDIDIADSLTLGVNEDSDSEIESFLEQYSHPYTMIIPGGSTNQNRQGRIWNIDKWKELCNSILSKYGGTIFVCGSKFERKTHEKLSGNNIILKSGDYTLVESSALLSHADLVISGDTGPLHIASAQNVNTLAILGSTSPNKIKPYGPRGYYVSANNGCRFCWKKKCKYLTSNQVYTPCMENITPQMIMEKIEDYNLLPGDTAN